MAKKKKKGQSGLILVGIACLLGIVAVCMMFADAVAYGIGELKEPVSGLKTAFGYSESKLGITVDILTPNAFAMLGYLLPVAGILIALIGRNSKLLTFIAMGVFAAAGICAFLMATTFPATVIGNELLKLEAALAWGAIVSAICSLIAAAALLFKVLTVK